MIGIIVPSRGLIHSRTAEYLVKILEYSEEGDVQFYFSHDKSIPDCYNVPVQNALKDKHDFIFIIEEDILPNDETLLKMSAALVEDKLDIVATDYKLRNGEDCFFYSKGILLGGLGFVMMTSDAAKELFPLRTSVSYSMPNLEPFEALPNTYGQHDIDFWIRAHEKGFKTRLVGKVGHLMVKSHGKENTNNGTHEVVEC